MTFVSYAQNFEDVLLWRALQGVECGFYIDVGAAHPDINSVTRAFYDRGWSGINVEPTEEYGLRLAAARPRDINLQIVLGEQPGAARLLMVDGTGLSTLDAGAEAGLAEAGLAIRPRICAMETLAELCDRYAPPVIHFLKVDVEGAEQAVLAGADLVRHRPWIVLVEATAPMSMTPTHASWEPLLLQAGYGFVWFDGLNRFYVADEKSDELGQYFHAPPNVFDDFVRAADSELARRIGDAERRAAGLVDRASSAEAQAAASAAAAAAAIQAAQSQAAESIQASASLRIALLLERQQRQDILTWAHGAQQRLDLGDAQRDAALRWLKAVFASTSWRVTSLLRRLRSGADTVLPQFQDLPTLPPLPTQSQELNRETGIDNWAESMQRSPAMAADTGRGQALRTVHQFHSGSAVGDAITNAMLMTRDVLRRLGYRSEVFVEHRDPLLAAELRLFDELPRHDHYVLIVHHSMGYDAFSRISALPAPKVLYYHNITPPEMLAMNPIMQGYARLGRAQLALWRGGVAAALADSEYNALEVRALGFDAVQACTMLVDVDALLRRVAAATPPPSGRPLTVIFVGRVCAAKGQTALVDAYAAFQARFGRPSRLILVGRNDGKSDAYVKDIRARAASGGVSDTVVLVGLVSDEELHDYYAAADVFVCLSQHEGFCVPIIEAIAHRLPVLARPAGAVGYTLGDVDGLLVDADPGVVAGRILALANEPEKRDALRGRQRATLERFRLDRQIPTLLQAIARAGAAPPIQEDARRMLAANMYFAIAGHVNGSYSLASVNRVLALNLDALHPGRVRLTPIEGEPTTKLDSVPSAMRDDLARLAATPPPGSGPEVVISQHYPVYVPSQRGDLTIALFFWEESENPARNCRVARSILRCRVRSVAFRCKGADRLWCVDPGEGRWLYA